jgi:putative ABC transport system permease protein
MPDALRRFIAVVSRLAPAWARREFRREWNAELTYAWADAQPRARVLVRAAGAIPDAWSLFRQQWSLDMLAQDVRYAWRLLRQRTGYTALIIGTLAIGIGANTAMFSVIEGVLLRTLPYPDPSRLVRIWENDRVHGKPRYTVAPANFADWRAQSHALASMSVFLPEGVSLSDGEDPFHANVAVVSTDFLRTLGVRPMIGRDFTAADTPPAQRVLILSHAAWMSHFGGDPGILERTVRLGDKPYRVIAIMGRDFGFPDRTVDAWRPMAESPDLMAVRAQHFFNVIARVKPGVTLTQARDDLEAIAVAEQRAYPATNEQRGTTMVRLQDALVGDVRAPMVYLGAAVVLLLLIGCANVANLMLAQASARRREIAVRAALGADRLRIVRQLLVEGLLLAGAGGLAGLAIAEWGTRLVGRMAVDYIPRMADVGMDPWVLGYAAVLSIVTGLVFALAPAVRASRADVQQDLRDGGRGATSSGRGMRRTLVVVEFAAAVVLVTGAGLLFASFRHVLRIDPGFATSQVLSVETELPQSRYGEDAALTRFYADFLARVSALPGVRAAGVVNNLPLSNNAWTSSLRIENRPEPQGQPPEVGYRSASAGYLSAMEIPLLDGRWFADGDTATSPRVVVVNKALVERFFPQGGAVGARIRLGPNPKAPWRSIVGVIGNVRHHGPEEPVEPEAYEPFAQDPFEGTVVVRADGDRAAVIASLRAVSRSIDPSVVLFHAEWMDGLMDEHLAPRRLSLRLVEGFAALALGLALLGIYGVMSYSVAQRVPEIGVRVALGAAPSEIHRMVLREGLRLAAPGLATGLVLALGSAWIARSILFEISPADPATYGVVIVMVLAVSLAACYIPARRAARVDPIRAIRRL